MLSLCSQQAPASSQLSNHTDQIAPSCIPLVWLVQVLAGVHIMFSRVIPLQDGHPEWHPMWRKAVKFGATCTTHPSDAVTHVAAYVNGTEKVWVLLQPFVAFSGL